VYRKSTNKIHYKLIRNSFSSVLSVNLQSLLMCHLHNPKWDFLTPIFLSYFSPYVEVKKTKFESSFWRWWSYSFSREKRSEWEFRFYFVISSCREAEREDKNGGKWKRIKSHLSFDICYMALSMKIFSHWIFTQKYFLFHTEKTHE
jgi:hypothetical protein